MKPYLAALVGTVSLSRRNEAAIGRLELHVAHPAYAHAGIDKLGSENGDALVGTRWQRRSGIGAATYEECNHNAKGDRAEEVFWGFCKHRMRSVLQV